MDIEGGHEVQDDSKSKRKPLYMQVEVDNGWCWIICGCVCINDLIVGGTVKLNGMLFVEYQELFMQSATATVWITSTWSICMTVLSPLAGYLADTLHLQRIRMLLFVMHFIASVMVALAGYMPNLPLTILVYGAIFGTATALAGASVVSLPSLYFNKKRTTAYGITFSGSSLGGLIFPILFAECVSYFSFRGAMLILSGIWFHTLFLPMVAWPFKSEKIIVMKSIEHNTDLKNSATSCDILNEPLPSTSDTDQPPTIDLKKNKSLSVPNKVGHAVLSMLRSYARFLKLPQMLVLLVVILLGLFAYFNQYFVLPILAQELGITKKISSAMLSILSRIELVSKIVAGIIIDKYGVSNKYVLLISLTLSGSAGLVVSFFLNVYVLFAYVVFLGVFGGVTLVLGIPLMVEISGTSQKGVASAMLVLLFGLGTALGPVILGGVGEALESHIHSFRALAVAYILAALLYLVPVIKDRRCKRGSLDITTSPQIQSAA